MSTIDVENHGENVPPSSPIQSSRYETYASKPVNQVKSFVGAKCTTVVAFFRTIYGILNLVAIALVCVLISAGLANSDTTRLTDGLAGLSSVKISAYDTRNSILAFAVIVLFLVLVDIIVYTTGVIKRLPKIFDLIFMITMFVMAVVLLILGCCSSAWAKKGYDTKVGGGSSWGNIAAAVASAIFLFIAMIAIIANYVLRIFRPIQRDKF
ncbi:unnamed protein product [Rotaria socialis]|uniref:MARVEL domain-containing protein n=2 Tax=Rotaria socialis TaxID=392032 RepID=A0A818AWP0_9BILA|nr:unnamed protein product [Rotaria socialis]CAF3409759.1 unnamed protein product [Rotaria socialis]